ncbi:helix-turn-helix domain-containing protein (plasmid) [Haladaptatus sp. SPP-AMP-3]|uniref:helix-turn-helix domain-containing protein n=1 Tax=Haladaptatus sp. SPP-AMP-3 TaxID=3121295 RepID=UPI003C2F0D29
MKQVSMTVSYTVETAQQTHRQVMEDDSISRVDLLVWGPLLGVPTLSWFDGDESAVASLLGRVESVSDAYLVPGDEGTYAFVERSEYEFGSEVLALISGTRVAFVPPLSFFDTGELRFTAVGEQAALSALYSDVAALLSVRIERLQTFHPHRPVPSITERQRRALVAALDAGYYDVPRTGSVDDVAAALDCAHSTAGELLRKAESAVISDAIGGNGVYGRSPL